MEDGIFQGVLFLSLNANDQVSATEALHWLLGGTEGLGHVVRCAADEGVAALLKTGALRGALKLDDALVKKYLVTLGTRTVADSSLNPAPRKVGDTLLLPAQKVPALDYPKRLKRWAKAALAEEEFEYAVTLGEPTSPTLAALFDHGVLFASGAAPDAIEAAEKRLGVSLPPSYRQFLLASNGLLVASQSTNLLPADDICWFAEANQDWIDAWSEGGEEDDMDDEQYLTYGDDQDCVWMRREYLKTALQISDCSSGDVLLLNPAVKFGDEWEAWLFGNTLPGAIRYRSFAELIEAQVFNYSAD